MRDIKQYKTYGKNHRALRLEGWNYATACIYHVVLSMYRRHILFDTPAHVGVFVDALREQAAYTHYTIYAFCVMPDHVHLLCQPPMLEDSGRGSSGGLKPPLQPPLQPIGLSLFIQFLKSKTTRRLRLLGVEGPIWQRGFDHILRKDEKLPVLQEYILNNPVRAGLVNDCDEYPFSFASVIKAYAGPRNVVALPEEDTRKCR